MIYLYFEIYIGILFYVYREIYFQISILSTISFFLGLYIKCFTLGSKDRFGMECRYIAELRLVLAHGM